MPLFMSLPSFSLFCVVPRSPPPPMPFSPAEPPALAQPPSSEEAPAVAPLGACVRARVSE